MLTLFLLGIVFCLLMGKFVFDPFYFGALGIGLGTINWVSQNYQKFDNIFQMFYLIR
jgi:hypothetical protein